MKKIVLSGAVIFSLVACTNSGKTEENTEVRTGIADSALMHQSDSARAKGERTLEAIKEKVREIGNGNDSLKTDSINKP